MFIVVACDTTGIVLVGPGLAVIVARVDNCRWVMDSRGWRHHLLVIIDAFSIRFDTGRIAQIVQLGTANEGTIGFIGSEWT